MSAIWQRRDGASSSTLAGNQRHPPSSDLRTAARPNLPPSAIPDTPPLLITVIDNRSDTDRTASFVAKSA